MKRMKKVSLLLIGVGVLGIMAITGSTGGQTDNMTTAFGFDEYPSFLKAHTAAV